MSAADGAWNRLVDRRGPDRGDARRDALLDAFDQLLQEQSLDDDQRRRDLAPRGGDPLGVLLLLREQGARGRRPHAGPVRRRGRRQRAAGQGRGRPAERIRAAIAMLFDSRRHQSAHLSARLLEARSSDPDVRQMWDAGLADFVGRHRRDDPTPSGLPGGRPTDPTPARWRRSCSTSTTAGWSGMRSGPDRRATSTSTPLACVWLRTIYGTASDRGRNGEHDMTPDILTFDSEGTTCEAWHFAAEHDGLADRGGTSRRRDGARPGRHQGLRAGAVRRGVRRRGARRTRLRLPRLRRQRRSPAPGRVGAAPRSRTTARLSAAAASLPGVDPSRLVLWGVSMAGGHVLEAAARRADVAAVVALTPLVDGLAAGRHALGTTRRASCSARPAPASGAGSRRPSAPAR